MHKILKLYNIVPDVVEIDFTRSEHFLWALVFFQVDEEIENQRYGNG